MRVNKVFSRRRTVCRNYTQATQETVTCGSGWIGLCHGQVGGGGKTLHKEQGSSLHLAFPSYISSSLWALGRMHPAKPGSTP